MENEIIVGLLLLIVSFVYYSTHSNLSGMQDRFCHPVYVF